MAVREMVRPGGRRVRGLAPLLLAGVLALSSCALDAQLVRDAPVPQVEAPVVAARCPTTAGAVEDIEVPTIPSGDRPAGFRAVGVVRCTVETTQDEAGRTTSAVTVDRASATAELEQSLELPDQVFVDPDQGACTADAVLLPLLLLVDGGRARLSTSPAAHGVRQTAARARPRPGRAGVRPGRPLRRGRARLTGF